MLKQLPEVGQFVLATQDDGEQYEGQYLTKDKVYEIVGTSTMNGNPYHIDDTGNQQFIDEEALFLYELCKNE